MNILNKIALATVILMMSAQTQAELELLDDEKMSDIKAQSGITIDIELELSVGEFAFKDGGSILVQGLHIGGSKNGSGRTYSYSSK